MSQSFNVSPNGLPQGFPQGATPGDAMMMMQYDANKKSALVAYVLWFFLGWLGIHRFYLGRTMSGVVMSCAFLLVLTLPALALRKAHEGPAPGAAPQAAARQAAE